MQQYHSVGVKGALAQEVVVKENQFIASANEQYALLLNKNGNLCLYPNGVFNKTFFWHANCAKKGVNPCTLKLQKDGNLVVTDSKNKKTFQSVNHRTYKKGVAPFRLVVQDNRNVEVLDKNNQICFESVSGIYTPSKPHPEGYEFVGFNGRLRQDFVVAQEKILVSKNEEYSFMINKNGNLCLYPFGVYDKTYIWNANCAKKGEAPISYKLNSEDGNLQVFDAKNKMIFDTINHQSYKQGQAPFRLCIQDDRTIQILDNNDQICFKTKTALKKEEETKQEEKEEVYVPTKPHPEGFEFVGNKQGTLRQDVVVKQKQCLVSANEEYSLMLNDNGNLCLYPFGVYDKNFYWNANCAKKGVAPISYKLNKDQGSLQVFDSKNTVIFDTVNHQSYQKGEAPFRLVIQDDRVISIVDVNDQVCFKTKTAVKKPVVEEVEEEIDEQKEEEQEQQQQEFEQQEQEEVANPEEEKKEKEKKDKLTKEQKIKKFTKEQNQLRDDLQTLGFQRLMENVKYELAKTTAFPQLDQAYFAQQQVIEGEKLKVHQMNQQRIIQAQAQGQNVQAIQDEVNNEYNILSTELQTELAGYHRQNQIRIQGGQGVDKNLDATHQKDLKKIEGLIEKKSKRLATVDKKLAQL